jgi:LacI family transcriptional regulator
MRAEHDSDRSMNISQFAKSLNLSTGTVSRALNDRPEVSEETRRFVLEKAREVGYSRNPNARYLATGRNFMIRLEYPYNTHILSDRYLVELARALEEAAGEKGYDLLLHLGRRRPDGENAYAADGLVVVGSPETTAADLHKLTSAGRIPSVVIIDTEKPDFPLASYVYLDTLSGIRDAFQYLASLGHRRVGYIGSAGTQAQTAILALMAEAGLTLNQSYVCETGTTQQQGKAAVQILGLPTPPTALFARTDILASGAVQAANLLGLGVPGDLSVIGHDNIEIAALVSPPLTTVAIDITSVAQTAIDSLLAMITDKAAPTVRALGTHLVIRRSCSSAP